MFLNLPASQQVTPEGRHDHWRTTLRLPTFHHDPHVLLVGEVVVDDHGFVEGTAAPQGDVASTPRPQEGRHDAPGVPEGDRPEHSSPGLPEGHSQGRGGHSSPGEQKFRLENKNKEA